MSRNRFVSLILAAGLLSSGSGHAGAGGAGNTGDNSIQFAFAKSTAAQILQSVSVPSLAVASGRPSVAKFYENCRDQMYLGALRTRFELVDSIPDGAGYHALAQRLPGGILRISRVEMEKLAEMRQLTAPFLTALVLHEVGHDCASDGVVADDRADALLNDLSEALLRAAGNNTLVHLVDVDFIERVGRGESVRWIDLSSRVRRELARKYADYVGDWVYLKNRSQFSERPAPASQFYTSEATSLIPGWGTSVPLHAGAQLKGVVDQLLAATYKSQDLSFYDSSEQSSNPGTARTKALPTALVCRANDRSASCRVAVSWAAAGLDSLVSFAPEIHFTIDIFGELKIERIRIKE
ncbi:MAG: hypothetical protein A2X94_10735 [Bdellovibrionales bacterium GWB1_55_8]|nr:MAG: hypothetical protein A2X94_10735 [Bdellovibrionales bacterium GWB1_55_8]